MILCKGKVLYMHAQLKYIHICKHLRNTISSILILLLKVVVRLSLVSSSTCLLTGAGNGFLWSRTFNLLTWKAEKQMHKYSEVFVESFPQCPQQPGLSQTGVRSHEAILVSHANGRHQEMDSSPGASRGALAGSRNPKWCKRSKQGTPGLNPDTRHKPQEWLSTIKAGHSRS